MTARATRRTLSTSSDLPFSHELARDLLDLVQRRADAAGGVSGDEVLTALISVVSEAAVRVRLSPDDFHKWTNAVGARIAERLLADLPEASRALTGEAARAPATDLAIVLGEERAAFAKAVLS